MTLTLKSIILFCYMKFGLRLAAIISISDQEEMMQTIELILEGNILYIFMFYCKYFLFHCSVRN